MKGCLVVLCLLVSTAVFGLEVDRAELSKAEGANVHFVNYVGPHLIVDTLDEIYGIGRSLGPAVTTAGGETSYFGKYRIIHAVGPAEGEKLDADIFIIEKDAEVDNITNVMRIVGGYLEAAYGYSPQDAATLARFVVYYNAVYRGDMTYLSKVYKPIVMSHLSAADAGIATVYSEWPGRTRMLIPLSAGPAGGSAGALSTGQLTAPKVIENLRTEPNRGIPARQAMTELRQRELQQGQSKVAEEQKGLAGQRQKLAEQEQALSSAESKLAQANQAATAPGAGPGEKQAAAAQAAEVAKQKAAVQATQGAVEKGQAAVAAQEQRLANQEKSIQAQRAGIASDEQALIQQSEKKAETNRAQTASSAAAVAQPPQPSPAVGLAEGGPVLFLYDTSDSSEHLGKLVLVDASTGKVLAISELNTIRERRWVALPGAIVVMAGRANRGGAVRLVSLNPSSLVTTGEGTNNLVPSSYLVESGGSIFAVVSDSGGAHLARFDKALKLQAESTSRVDPHSFLAVDGKVVLVQDSSGNILILRADDLRNAGPGG